MEAYKGWEHIPLPALRIVLTYLSSHDLRAAAQTCSSWRIESRYARRLNAQSLAKIAFIWIGRNQGKLLLSGSMARYLYDQCPLSWFPNDCDLFWCAETADPGVEEETVTPPQNYVGLPITFAVGGRPLIVNMPYREGRVQLILSAFTSVNECLNSFDLSCVMLGFLSPSDVRFGKKFTNDSIYVYELREDYPDRLTGEQRKPYRSMLAHIQKIRERTRKRTIMYKERLQIAHELRVPSDIISLFWNVYNTS